MTGIYALDFVKETWPDIHWEKWTHLYDNEYLVISKYKSDLVLVNDTSMLRFRASENIPLPKSELQKYREYLLQNGPWGNFSIPGQLDIVREFLEWREKNAQRG